MQPKTEDNERQTPPTTACPVWCIDHDADGPDEADDHLHEATPAIVPCIALERSTDDTGAIQHHPAAVELSLVRYQYRTGDDTWLYIGDGSRGLDISLESARRLVRALGRYVADER
ncbi:hypothetical protein BKH24_03010 [Actinomyces oris]|uniref:hypothetical protein n=1 Tax=Actinomyces oris TaxID=544580 RepID=UPI00094DDF30|nr:hypothetical protein [Actinomyces oris]OLO62011.1 hypothetical protein BKH24_03010 [Actinomyces oris]